jgi:hypothetical protein
MRTCPILVAALVAMMLCSARAGADPAAERQARALFDEGNAFVRKGDFQDALDRFQRAYALFPSVKLLLNIATMQKELGHDVEAANTYQRYLQSPAADPQKSAEVVGVLSSLDRRLGTLEVELADPALAVRLDGQLAGEYRIARVAPGSHALTAERDGAVVVAEIVTIGAGERRKVLLKAAPPPPPAPAPAPAPPPPSAPAPGPAAAPPPPPLPAPAAAPPAPIVAPPAGPPADAPARSAPSLSHRTQLGAVARADIEGRGRGVAGSFGVSFGLGDHAEISASALIGRNKGVEPAVTAFILPGAVKPMITAGVPIFIVDGPRPGVRVGAGVEWDPIRYFGVFAQAAVAAFPNAPAGYDRVVFLPNAGVQGRVF